MIARAKEAFGLKLYTDKELLRSWQNLLCRCVFLSFLLLILLVLQLEIMLPEQLKSIADSLGTFFRAFL